MDGAALLGVDLEEPDGFGSRTDVKCVLLRAMRNPCTAMNLYKVFHQTVCRQPARPAILGPGPQEELSYAELDGAIRSAANNLRTAGVRPGQCVGLHCPSGAEYIICT